MDNERAWFPYRRDLEIHPKTDTFTLLVVFHILEGHFVQNGQPWMLIPSDPKKLLKTLGAPKKKWTGNLFMRAKHFAASRTLEKFGGGSLVVKPTPHELHSLSKDGRELYRSGHVVYINPGVLRNPFGKGWGGFIPIHSQIRHKTFKYSLRRYDLWLYLMLAGECNIKSDDIVTLTFKKLKKYGLAAPDNSRKRTRKTVTASLQRLQNAGLLAAFQITPAKIRTNLLYGTQI